MGILGPPSYGIGATIRIGREMLCLPYAGFFFLCSLHLNVFLSPLPKVQCPKFLDFLTPWGKLMEKWSQIWILLLIKGVKLPRKIFLIFDELCLTSRICLVLVLQSALVERCFVSRMRDFKKFYWHFTDLDQPCSVFQRNYALHTHQDIILKGIFYIPYQTTEKIIKNNRILETPSLLTDADISTATFCLHRRQQRCRIRFFWTTTNFFSLKNSNFYDTQTLKLWWKSKFKLWWNSKTKIVMKL